MKATLSIASLFLLVVATAGAQEPQGPRLQVPMRAMGQDIGTITLINTPYGVYAQPELKGLPVGYHRIEARRGDSCDNPGAVMEPPRRTFRRVGEGDEIENIADYRPTLVVEEGGEATSAFMMARGFILRDLLSRPIVILPDTAEPGGQPAACGMVPARARP